MNALKPVICYDHLKMDNHQLYQKSQVIRRHVIQMLTESGSGHPASALGLADLFTSLYFGGILKYRPNDPKWPHRDILMMSNGHVCPVWYATLAEAGFFSIKDLSTLRKLNSHLQGHPHHGSTPGIENTSGPLGQGLSQAVGIALGLYIQNRTNRVYCVLSDAEHQEGQTWEAYQAASHYQLHNLTAIIDRNMIQIDGNTENTMSLEPFEDKIASFGWKVFKIDGHNIEEIISVFNNSKNNLDKPIAIVCNTTPGKGVSFMENNYIWHGKTPNDDQSKIALEQLSHTFTN